MRSVVVVLSAKTCAMMPMLRMSARDMVRGIAIPSKFEGTAGEAQKAHKAPSLRGLEVTGGRPVLTGAEFDTAGRVCRKNFAQSRVAPGDFCHSLNGDLLDADSPGCKRRGTCVGSTATAQHR